MASSASTQSGDPLERTTVLEVFGVKLSVRNRRLAEILTMDAAEALGLDKRPAGKGSGPSEVLEPEVAIEAVPDILLPVGGTGEDAESLLRADIRRRADAVATEMGFDVLGGGRWRPPSAPLIHTRVVARTPTPAAATDMIEKIADAVLAPSGMSESGLLVTAAREAVPTLLDAIAARGLRASFRVLAAEELELVRDVCMRNPSPAATAAALLSPAGAVDVGRLLAAFEWGGS